MTNVITLKAIMVGGTEETDTFNVINYDNKVVGQFRADTDDWPTFKDSLFLCMKLKTALKELKVEKITELCWDLAHTYSVVNIIPYTAKGELKTISAKIRADNLSADIIYRGDVVGTIYRLDDNSTWDDGWAGQTLIEWCQDIRLHSEDLLILVPLMRVVCNESYDSGVK